LHYLFCRTCAVLTICLYGGVLAKAGPNEHKSGVGEVAIATEGSRSWALGAAALQPAPARAIDVSSSCTPSCILICEQCSYLYFQKISSRRRERRQRRPISNRYRRFPVRYRSFWADGL